MCDQYATTQASRLNPKEMKLYIMSIKNHLFAVAVMSAVAVGASAQTVNDTPQTAVPLNQIRTGIVVQNSATSPLQVPVNAFENVSVNCQGTATTTSASIAVVLPDGSLTSATTLNCTTTMTQVMNFASSANGAVGVSVSPTAGLSGVNTVKTVIVRKPTVYRP